MMMSSSIDDVFKYCEDNDVPIQTDRYGKVGELWGELEDRRNNCDYVHACTLCLDKREDAPKFVDCPKMKMRVANVSERVLWADQTIPAYMEEDHKYGQNLAGQTSVQLSVAVLLWAMHTQALVPTLHRG
jgi:hypothetical protein